MLCCRNGRVCVWESSLELSELEVEAVGPPDKKRREAEEEDDVDLSKGEERADALAKQQQGLSFLYFHFPVFIYSGTKLVLCFLGFIFLFSNIFDQCRQKDFINRVESKAF